MSKVNELFTKVKEAFAEVQAPAAPVVENNLAASTAKLSDGTEVSYDKLEVGGVMMVGEAPCAAGDYTLEDGTTVSVGDAGVITAVQPKEEMATEPEQPVQAPQFNAQEFEERLTGYAKRIEALELALATAKSENEKIQAAYTKVIEFSKVTNELVETLVGKPSVEPPVQRKAVTFSKISVKEKGLEKYTKAAQQIAEGA